MRGFLHRPRSVSRGLTLIEVCVVVAIVAIVARLAAPSYDRAVSRHQLEGVARQLEADIRYGRSEAVARHRPLRLDFPKQPEGGCYVLHDGAAQACTCLAPVGAKCPSGVEAVRAVLLPAGGPVTLSSPSKSIVFDPVRGTVSPTATVKLTGSDGAAIHAIVNITGRVRSCSPDRAVAGFKAC